MNGAVPKADFVRGQNRLIGGNHVKKNSYFRDADIGNTAVGMQKGKSLFTTQHQVTPQPTVDSVTPAKQEMKDFPLNTQERRNEYTKRNWKQDETTTVKPETFDWKDSAKEVVKSFAIPGYYAYKTASSLYSKMMEEPGNK
jgi:hypothetical protein